MPLKVVQSVDESNPLIAAVAVGILKVKVPDELVIPQSLLIAVVEVAKVIVPVWALPYVCCKEVTAEVRYAPAT